LAVYTKLNEKEIKSIINDYPIGNLIEFKGIQEGIENTNYFIRTKKGKFILTIFENRVDSKEIPFFINLMKFLNKNDFISPKPIENNEGIILNKFNTKKFILVNFLEGKPKVNITHNDCYLIGDLIGNLQNKSRYCDLIRKNSLSLEDCKKIFQDCKNSISEKEIDNLSNGLCDLIEDSLKDCLEKWPSHLPKGIIHGDLFPDNVFFLNNKVSGVIDFYFSCVDIKIYEIAIVINAWCFDQHNTLNIEKVKNLIKGFTLHNNLTKDEIFSLNILAKGASLRFLITRLFDWYNTPENSYVKRKDPQEYIDKLLYFNSNTLDFLYD